MVSKDNKSSPARTLGHLKEIGPGSECWIEHHTLDFNVMVSPPLKN